MGQVMSANDGTGVLACINSTTSVQWSLAPLYTYHSKQERMDCKVSALQTGLTVGPLLQPRAALKVLRRHFAW